VLGVIFSLLLEKTMLKLYKRTENVFKYWETWDESDKVGIIHWGEVGTRGKDKKINTPVICEHHNRIQKEINTMVQDGYAPIELDQHFTLLIEYEINGMGNDTDLQKRHNLENRMNETLGWTGLGHCDGGSIGSGTMEVCCFVVDFNIAKKIIEEDLKNTLYSDYIRVYDENAE
jgi:hypothetical protein